MREHAEIAVARVGKVRPEPDGLSRLVRAFEDPLVGAASGLLWPDGRVGGAYENTTQWSQLGLLMKAAIQGVKDAAGNALAADVVWTFTVNTSLPTVTATTPLNGAATNNTATTVTATFSEAMTVASISGTTVLLTGPGTTAVPATLTYSAAALTATLTPTAALTNGTLYTATVKSGICALMAEPSGALVRASRSWVTASPVRSASVTTSA